MNVHSQSYRLSECKRSLASPGHFSITELPAAEGQFEVHNPTPLTHDAGAFRNAVDAAAARYDLTVIETRDPFRLVVSAF